MYPVLFRVGHFAIQTVGVLHASAIVVGAWWFFREVRDSKVSPSEVYNLVVVIVVSSIIGARLFSILFDGYLSVYLTHPALAFAVWDGGFVFYGGLIFGLTACIWYLRKHRVDVWRVADKAAPALGLALAIGRTC